MAPAPTTQHDQARKETIEATDATGVGTGLEQERPAEDGGEIQAPFDPKLIDVITQQRTVDLLLNRMKHGEINLSPDFQRAANLWSTEQKSSLIESMLLRIPLPSLYVYEDDEGNYEVVDGLQRLCAITHFIDVGALNKALSLKFDPLRLTELQSLKEQGDRTFHELPRPLQRRLLETELTLHVIRAGTPARVKFSIFSRINRGGLPLTAEEIRNAVYRGPWRDHVRKMASSEHFLSATRNAIRSTRQENHELVLRFCAHFALDKDSQRPEKENLDDFLNDFVEIQSASWSGEQWSQVEQAFYKALKYSQLILGPYAFRKFYETDEGRLRPINRGLFESQTVVLARLPTDALDRLVARKDYVIRELAECFEYDDDLRSALLYATGRGASSNRRLKTLRAAFEKYSNA